MLISKRLLPERAVRLSRFPFSHVERKAASWPDVTELRAFQAPQIPAEEVDIAVRDDTEAVLAEAAGIAEQPGRLDFEQVQADAEQIGPRTAAILPALVSEDFARL